EPVQVVADRVVLGPRDERIDELAPLGEERLGLSAQLRLALCALLVLALGALAAILGGHPRRLHGRLRARDRKAQRAEAEHQSATSRSATCSSTTENRPLSSFASVPIAMF